MKKIVMSLAALTATVALSAAETPKETATEVKEAPKAKQSSALLAGGTINGELKAMHILQDKHNGFAPEDGSGYLGVLGYTTPDVGLEGLRANATFYINGDTGLTDWNSGLKNAGGMFTDSNGQTNTIMGQAYVEYKSKMVNAKVGRQILNTPLTKIKWSLMPNFYEAAVATVNPIKSLSFTLAHIDGISYGSRSATDWGLIGEKTGTAGIAVAPVSAGGSLEQAKFHNIGTAAGVAETKGITAVNATYKMGKNLKVSLWDYYAHDIANMLYADAAYSMAVMKGTKLSVSAQYLTQNDTGAKLAGELNFKMHGAKVKVGNKKWSAYIAYNGSNNNEDSSINSGFLNAWGSDPAYTSSLFSRNAYREDVTAYKIGGHYTIMKGLKIIVSHADYGQSKTKVAKTDATETDIIIAYKPTKAWTLKVFNAIRTSEYDSATAEKEMNHFRAVASYKF